MGPREHALRARELVQGEPCEADATEGKPRAWRGQRVALGVLMAIAFLAVAWMAAPLLVGLALGTVMGFTAQPLHARLVVRLRERR